jgi:hypothetical protein
MSLGTDIAPHLPALRRYGRLITGSQSAGDVMVRATLENIVADPTIFPRSVGARVGIYKVFYETSGEVDVFSKSPTNDDDAEVINSVLYQSLMSLDRRSREAFLLTASEGFTYEQAAFILQDTSWNVEKAVKRALDTAGGIEDSLIADESVEAMIGALDDNQQYQEILSLAPAPYAPKISAVNGKVHLAQEALSLPADVLRMLELLRSDHLEEAIAMQAEVGNLGPAFNRRVDAAIKLLSVPLTDDSSLRLANQVNAMNAMKAVIAEEMMASTAASLIGFIDQLLLYCSKFPAWRAFNEEPAATPNAVDIATLVEVIRDDVPRVVGQDVQDAIAEAVEVPLTESGMEQAYLNGLVHNVLSEAGRYLLARKDGAAKKFNEKMDEQIGEGLAVGLSNIFIAASTPLLALAVQLPSHWAWAGPAIAAARVIIGRK